MAELNKVHTKSVVLMIGIPIMAILLWIAFAFFFRIVIPSWVIAVIALLCPLNSARMRLKVWAKKDILLSDSEQQLMQTKIFFAMIPVEILFSVIGLGFIFS